MTAKLVSSPVADTDVSSVTFEFNRLWKDLSRVDSKNEPNTNQPCPQFVDYLCFLGILDMVPSAKIFSLCTYI